MTMAGPGMQTMTAPAPAPVHQTRMRHQGTVLQLQTPQKGGWMIPTRNIPRHEKHIAIQEAIALRLRRGTPTIPTI